MLWMSAARGIIHSEMPQQSEGRMRGFQLWLNLPAKEKMKPAAYRDIAATEIPSVKGPRVETRVIAGTLGTTVGPIHGGSTDPYYFDVHLEARPGAEKDPRAQGGAGRLSSKWVSGRRGAGHRGRASSPAPRHPTARAGRA